MKITASIFCVLCFFCTTMRAQENFSELEKTLSNYHSNQLTELWVKVNYYEDLKKSPLSSQTFFSEQGYGSGYVKAGSTEIIYDDSCSLYIDHDSRMMHYSRESLRPEPLLFLAVIDSLRKYTGVKSESKTIAPGLQEITIKIPDSAMPSIVIQHDTERHVLTHILIEVVTDYDFYADHYEKVWYEFIYEDFKRMDQPFPKDKYALKKYLVFHENSMVPAAEYTGFTVVQ